jgi:hypothetical protein
MNHPEQEEWIPYVCGEATRDERQRLSEHLRNCPDCRREIESWKRSLSRLDRWRLPAPPRNSQAFAPLLKWAVPAFGVVVLALVFAAGRFSGKSASAEQLRAVLEPRLRQELQNEFAPMIRYEIAKSSAITMDAARQQTQELLSAAAQVLETRRANDTRAVYAAMDKLYVALKKDLDTVAVNTDAGLRRTENQLVQLADYAQPGNIPPSRQTHSIKN